MKYIAITVLTLFVLSVSCVDSNEKSTELTTATSTEPVTTSISEKNSTTVTITAIPTTNTTIITSTSTETTTLSSSTNKPTSSTASTSDPPPTTTTTKPPSPQKCSQFSFLSFIGGIILTIGLAFISALVYKFYKARTERNYHTL